MTIRWRKEAKTNIDKLIVEWNDLYYGKKMGNENPKNLK